jgi:hypothetical protein
MIKVICKLSSILTGKGKGHFSENTVLKTSIKLVYAGLAHLVEDLEVIFIA